MPRVRSHTINTIRRGFVHVGLGNFFIQDVQTRLGRMGIDVWAAFTGRVLTWTFSPSGTITNSSSFFSSVSTLSGSQAISVPANGSEKDFAYGKETIPIRFPIPETTVSFPCSTALTMIGTGASQQPFAPSTMGTTTGSTFGMTLGHLDTLQTPTGEEGKAEFLWTTSAGSEGTSTSSPDGSYPRGYSIRFLLQASPEGHPLDSGISVPVLVGEIIVRIPNWYDGAGINEFRMPLYADIIGTDNTWLAVTNNGGGGIDYGADNLAGTLNIVLTPAVCYGYEINGQRAWDDACNLLVPFEELAKGPINEV